MTPGPASPAPDAALPAWTIQRVGEGPLLASAIHQGHELRAEVAALTALGQEERLREEDPFTAEWTVIAPVRVVVHRSRFEVDLNRPPSQAVYRAPADAWGLDLWRTELPEAVVRSSLELHRAFYRELETVLADAADRNGAFVVYDFHSYNHRRRGPDVAADDPAANPEVNLGTGTLDRSRWGGVCDAFLDSLRAAAPGLDARENVRFRGGYLARWVHERFPHRGCVLAMEVKKTFMDEWTGRPDPARIAELREALAATVGPVTAALGRRVPALR